MSSTAAESSSTEPVRGGWSGSRARSKLGVVYTFYSYKGGVGRSMALANVGALLASWGNRVLLVDFDIEAPGLERFFGADTIAQRSLKPGVVDLLLGTKQHAPIAWRDGVIEIPLEGSSPNGRLALLTAGRDNNDYLDRVQQLDWPALFDDFGVGDFMFRLREEWTDAERSDAFDFVLIDSRTGVTDIGSLCTALLPDDVVMLFTTAEQSYRGVLNVADRAAAARSRIPRDLPRLRFLPLPARDEATTEWSTNREWRQRFAKAFDRMYRTWLPEKVTPLQAMAKLHVPYVPVWSFGERLPVQAAPDEISKPGTIASAYARLATLLLHRFDWEKLESRVTAHELEEERRLAHANLKAANDRIAKVESKARALTLFAGVMAGVLAIVLVNAIWTGFRSSKRDRVQYLLDEKLRELRPSEQYALVSELGRFPEPKHWSSILDEIWSKDVPTRLLRAGENRSITSVVFGPRSFRVAWTDGRRVAVESREGKVLAEYEGGKAIAKIAFDSSENRLVIARDDGLVVLPITGSIRKPLWFGQDGSSVAWGSATDADGMWVAEGPAPSKAGASTSQTQAMRQYPLATLPSVEPVKLTVIRSDSKAGTWTGVAAQISLSPNGKWIFISSGRRVTALEVVSGTLSNPTLIDGKLLHTTAWGALLERDDRVVAWFRDSKATQSYELSPSFEGTALTQSGERIAWTENLDSYRIAGNQLLPAEETALLPTPSLSVDGRLVKGEEVLHLWRPQEPTTPVGASAVISADGKVLVYKSGMDAPVVRIGDKERLLNLPTDPYVLAVSETGRFIGAGYWTEASGEQVRIHLLDTKLNSSTTQLRTGSDVNDLLVSEEFRTVAANTDDGLRAWDLPSKRLLPAPDRAFSGSLSRFYRDDGELYVALNDGERWRVTGPPLGRPTRVDSPTSPEAKAVRIQDGALVITAEGNSRSFGGQVEIVKIAGARVLMKVGLQHRLLEVGPEGWVPVSQFDQQLVAYSPKLDVLIMRSPNGVVPFWSNVRNEKQPEIPVAGSLVTGSFSGDGLWLTLSAGLESRLFFVSRKNHQLQDQTDFDSSRTREMSSFAFSQGGNYLVGAGEPRECASLSEELEGARSSSRAPRSVAALAARCQQRFEGCGSSLRELIKIGQQGGAPPFEIVAAAARDLRGCNAALARGDDSASPKQIILDTAALTDQGKRLNELWQELAAPADGSLLASSDVCTAWRRPRQRDVVELWCAERREGLETASWTKAISRFEQRAPGCLSPELRRRYFDVFSEEQAREDTKACEARRKTRN